MASQRNTGAFVLGGVVGGIVGAAITLWNTPKSGSELRATFTSGQATGPSATVVDTAPRGTRFDNPVLSFVERAAAPIVGVTLDKLAKDDGASATTTVHKTTYVAGASASHVDDREAGEHVATVATTRADDPEVGQHAATTDELTHPQGEGDVPPPADDPEEGQHVATMEELTRPQGEPPPNR